jgi:hypothetical protein
MNGQREGTAPMKNLTRSSLIGALLCILAIATASPSYAIDPQQPPDEPAAAEPPAPRRTPTPPRPADPCVQARADWDTLRDTTDVEMLHAYAASIPVSCSVQRVQVERLIAALTSSPSTASAPPVAATAIDRPAAPNRRANIVASLRARNALRLSVAPHIPVVIEQAARRHSGNREVLAVYDLSAFNGDGGNGLYFLEDGVIINELGEDPRYLAYDRLAQLRRTRCAYACVRYGDQVINLPEFGLFDEVGGILDTVVRATR